MGKNFNQLEKIFQKLIERPDKSNEMCSIIQNTLNSLFQDDNSNVCKKVFISNGNGTNPFNVLVIPHRPNKVMKMEHLNSYDIDIDLTSLINNHNSKGLTASEMTAWLIHELASNVFTNRTLLRFKKLIIKHYDTNKSIISDTIDSYGNMLWIGVFGRTSKENASEDVINEHKVYKILESAGYNAYWDSALAKYIASHGGDRNIITPEYVDRMDKVQLKEFNKIARKYSSYAIKYNNTEYSTMVKYIINSTHSELTKYYIEKEPQCIAVNPEKDVFYLFDDTKILLEDASDIDNSTVTTVKLYDKFKEVEKEIEAIESESDRLLCSVKVKELSNLINAKREVDNYDDILKQLQFDIDSLISKLKNKKPFKVISVKELS